MFLDCQDITALFPTAGYALHALQPCRLQWDCHHGTTFTLRVTGLATSKILQTSEDGSIVIKVSLYPPEKFISEAERFAASQSLELPLFALLPAALSVPAALSAAHLPEAGLFVFSEESRLTAQPVGRAHCQLAVTGPFKARRIPCQEADLIIHLDKQVSGRLLSFLLAQARS